MTSASLLTTRFGWTTDMLLFLSSIHLFDANAIAETFSPLTNLPAICAGHSRKECAGRQGQWWDP